MTAPVKLSGKSLPAARKMTLVRLAKIRTLIGEISRIWSDVDGWIETVCEEEIARIEALESDWRSAWAEEDAERADGGAA